MNENSTVEITSYDGANTIHTHVHRIKPLFETIVWKNEECIDFNDLIKLDSEELAMNEEALLTAEMSLKNFLPGKTCLDLID